MVMAIPLAVGIYHRSSVQYGDKDVLYDTYKGFYVLLKETTT